MTRSPLPRLVSPWQPYSCGGCTPTSLHLPRALRPTSTPLSLNTPRPDPTWTSYCAEPAAIALAFPRAEAWPGAERRAPEGPPEHARRASSRGPTSRADAPRATRRSTRPGQPARLFADDHGVVVRARRPQLQWLRGG